MYERPATHDEANARQLGPASVFFEVANADYMIFLFVDVPRQEIDTPKGRYSLTVEEFVDDVISKQVTNPSVKVIPFPTLHPHFWLGSNASELNAVLRPALLQRPSCRVSNRRRRISWSRAARKLRRRCRSPAIRRNRLRLTKPPRQHRACSAGANCAHPSNTTLPTPSQNKLGANSFGAKPLALWG